MYAKTLTCNTYKSVYAKTLTCNTSHLTFNTSHLTYKSFDIQYKSFDIQVICPPLAVDTYSRKVGDDGSRLVIIITCVNCINVTLLYLEVRKHELHTDSTWDMNPSFPLPLLSLSLSLSLSMWRRRRISEWNQKFHQQASVLGVRCCMRYALCYRQKTNRLLHINFAGRVSPVSPPGYVRTDWDYSYRIGCTEKNTGVRACVCIKSLSGLFKSRLHFWPSLGIPARNRTRSGKGLVLVHMCPHRSYPIFVLIGRRATT